MKNSEILMTSAVLLSLTVGLLLYVIFALYKLHKLKKDLSDGAESSNLEEILSAIAKKIQRLESQQKNTADDLNSLRDFTKLTIHKVGVHKYNALADEGGNLSFTIAFLDANDSGVVITSINGRNNTRTYIKIVQNGSSQIKLTEDEIAAIEQAGGKTKIDAN